MGVCSHASCIAMCPDGDTGTASWRDQPWYRAAVQEAFQETFPTRRLKLVLEFDGTDFKGWQWQPTGQRTVQGVLQTAMDNLPGVHSHFHGAGRTDAGVHALAMVAHLDTTSPLPCERIRLALNAHLPKDVAVLSVADVDDTFEAQFSATYRRYLYRMRIVRPSPRGLALDRHRVLMIHRALDVPAMKDAAQRLCGTHDFSSFATQETRSRVRTLHLCELREYQGDLELHVAADGFLRGMVRTIAGTLLRVGHGTVAPDEMGAILEARDRTRAGRSLPAHGLYFVEAGYDAWDATASERQVADRLARPR